MFGQNAQPQQMAVNPFQFAHQRAGSISAR
jgi:hypothetical protein